MQSFFLKVLYPLEPKDYKQILFILTLTIFCTIAELISIGLIIPILNLFAGNQFFDNFSYFPELSAISKQKILIIILLCFGFIHFLKFFFNKFLIKKQNKFCHNLFAKISKKFYKNYLQKDFIFFIKNNSSDLIRNVLSECNLYSFGVVFQIIRLISEIIIFSFICIVLLIYDPIISLMVILLFTSAGFFFLKTNNNRLKFWGEKRQFHSAIVLRQLQQSFTSFRELLINNMREIFFKKFSYHTMENAEVGINKDTVTQMPRLILELISVTILIFIIIYLTLLGKSISDIFVLLGVFFYCTIRLLPSISKIIQSIQNIRFNHVVVNVIYNELNQFDNKANLDNRTQSEKNNSKQSLIYKSIVFQNVVFSYTPTKKIFKNLNITINRGDKIGIVGKTGSGKSTFINLFSGLLKPSEGIIYIDDKKLDNILLNYQKEIGYVPQTVSVFDESIIFNICLKDNPDKEDINKVNEILRIVDLYEIIYQLPKNINEFAGEHGAKLSGGQNQRIGIARALYKSPSVLILDESTSAIDEKTEGKILNNIYDGFPNMTIVNISHRKSSLRYCKRMFEVKNSEISEIK